MSDHDRSPLLILLPVKRLGEAKQRLAGVLDAEHRARLVVAMLTDVVQILVKAELEPWVVTPDETVLSLTAKLGARGYRETAATGSLNAALDAAERTLRQPTGRLLVLLPDTPLVAVAELQELIAAGRDGDGLGADVVLAPDGARRGCNAMLLAPGIRLPFSFGEGSYARYAATAAATGLRSVEFNRPGLALDVDEPADIQAASELAIIRGAAPATLAFLSRT
ncbi:MAG: 2-phospho-L-lactate/phosphoenolpyruvate guanylyltransferase [Chloroflexota bacterium]|jgi:2-phospho-L-lactate guanylyltransferase|nr:2-phospho-L-lactate/phosphoenolpyruvate guanylyltransferase [Chloroflexota bacterium]